MRDEEIVVYAGEGSSHSWTWLADLFESKGIFNARFVDSSGLARLLHDHRGTVIVSGGDGLQIADSFRGTVFPRLKDFIRGGGKYVGMCAGAYLPLPSSLVPLNEFNLSTTRIENIDPRVHGQDVSPRLAVGYGSCSIVHPVRGEVALRGAGLDVVAPLYGGPVFREPEKDEVVFRYHAFTEDTELQVDRALARSQVLGRPAVIQSRYGSGEMLLFGPHLEHPRYPAANAAFLNIIGSPAGRARGRLEPIPDDEHHELRAALGDLKVAILGLENRSFLVGNKLWDGGRFLDLVAAIETRTANLGENTSQSVASKLIRARTILMDVRPDALEYSDSAPSLLVESARECVDRHFSALRGER